MPEDREYCAAFRRWRNIRSRDAPGLRRLLRVAACARRLVDCHVGSGAGWYVKSKLSGLRQAKAEKHRMDCVDCHNRPTHIYVHPDLSVDRALLAKSIDRSLVTAKRGSISGNCQHAGTRPPSTESSHGRMTFCFSDMATPYSGT